MVDRTVDLESDDRLDADTAVPDGIVDEYEHAQGPLIPGVNGNISRRFPEDGRYEVVLDACEWPGASRYSWTLDGEATITAESCATRVRLAEGPHQARLVVAEESGSESRYELTLEVRDLIVVGLGDSFSAGSGASRTGLAGLGYDNVVCTRSGRSGQARAALELEQRDTKTSVSFIHLACGGARADLGLLGPHNGQAPQLLELSEILPRGQAIDFLSMTIGGNDVHFSDVIGQLVSEPDAPLSLLEGERLHDRAQRQLLELRDRMQSVAACFAPGRSGVACRVRGPSGRDDDLRVVELAPLPVAAPARIVQVGYPDLTRFLVRTPGGGLVNTPGGPRIETCPSGAAQQPEDLVDGLPDGLLGGRLPRPPAQPFLSRNEWSWGDATLLQPDDPASDDDRPATYPYRREGGGSVALPLRNTLNSLAMESGTRFGWTPSMRWWQDSHGHGYCSAAADNWFFRSIFHPNDAGYAGKAQGLVAEADALGLRPSI